MSDVSYQNGDNFVRNMVTISTIGGPHGRGRPDLVKVRAQGLPVDVEEILEDLRVDDPDEERGVVERLAMAACDFIELRTGWSLRPTTYEIILSQWWTGAMRVERGPLRSVTGVSYLADRDDWRDLDPVSYWAAPRGDNFDLRCLSGFERPAPWQPEDSIRVRFDAGFDAHDTASGYLPIDDGLRTILLMITGHYYRNREIQGVADSKVGRTNVELGATSLLGAYRKFW